MNADTPETESTVFLILKRRQQSVQKNNRTLCFFRAINARMIPGTRPNKYPQYTHWGVHTFLTRCFEILCAVPHLAHTSGMLWVVPEDTSFIFHHLSIDADTPLAYLLKNLVMADSGADH